MSNKHFSDNFKESAIKKLLSPGGPEIRELSQNLGISTTTLYNWKRKYANPLDMKKSKKTTAFPWTPEKKLKTLLETFALSEEELGNYLRTNGLHSGDLERFKAESLEGFKQKGRPRLDSEVMALRKDKKKLERNLKRTEKALAQQSARIILLKKSHEIWGEPEDDE